MWGKTYLPHLVKNKKTTPRSRSPQAVLILIVYTQLQFFQLLLRLTEFVQGVALLVKDDTSLRSGSYIVEIMANSW